MDDNPKYIQALHVAKNAEVASKWTQAVAALGITCDCRLSTQWVVKIDGNEREAFLELANECAQKGGA